MKLSLESECKHQSNIILKQILIHHYKTSLNIFWNCISSSMHQVAVPNDSCMLWMCAIWWEIRNGRRENAWCSLFISKPAGSISVVFILTVIIPAFSQCHTFELKSQWTFLKKWFPALINFWYNEMSSDCLFSILHSHTHTHTHTHTLISKMTVTVRILTNSQ